MTREDHYVSTPHAPNSNPATSELTAQAAEDLLDDAAFMAKAAARMRAAGHGAKKAVQECATLHDSCAHYRRQIRAMEITTKAQDGVINELRNEIALHATVTKKLLDETAEKDCILHEQVNNIGETGARHTNEKAELNARIRGLESEVLTRSEQLVIEAKARAQERANLGTQFEAKLAEQYKAARERQSTHTRELQTANRQLDELSDLVGKREARIGSLEDEICELREPPVLVYSVPESKPEPDAPKPRKQASREVECSTAGHVLHKEYLVIRDGEPARFPCLSLGCRWLIGHPGLRVVPLPPMPGEKRGATPHDCAKDGHVVDLSSRSFDAAKNPRYTCAYCDSIGSAEAFRRADGGRVWRTANALDDKRQREANDAKRESDPDAPDPAIYEEIAIERMAQDARWGEQNHPSIPQGMSTLSACHELGIPSENHAKELCDRAAKKGKITYAHIVSEEFSESVEAKTERDRRGELVQLGACVVAWIEAIDRREKSKAEVAS